MRIRYCSITILAIQLTLLPLLSFAKNQKKAVSGRSSSVPDVLLHLDSDYCDRAWPYVYTDSGPDQAPSSSIGPATGRVDDELKFPAGILSSSNSFKITDPGSPILGQAEVELAPDGSDATRLLVRTLAGSPANTPCTAQTPLTPAGRTSNYFSFANAAYYLIDVIRWEAVLGKSAASYQVSSDNWYLFDFSDPKSSHRKFPFTFRPFVTSDLRIFGDARHPQKTNVIFLAISLAPQGEWEEWSHNVDVGYKLHADKVVPANIQDLQTLISFLVGQVPNKEVQSKAAGLNQPPPAFQGRYGAALVTNLRDLPAKLTSTMTATFKGPPSKSAPAYCAKVSKSLLTASGKPAGNCPSTSSVTSLSVPKLQFNNLEREAPPIRVAGTLGSHLLLTRYEFPLGNERAESADGAASSQAAPTGTPTTTTASGGTSSPPSSQTKTNTNCDTSTTSDPQTQANVQKPCSLTQTIQDEGLYHWDVSIAVPITGYKDTVFDSSNNLIPKSVTRTNAYAMLDIAPWGEDFVKPPMFGIPHIMTGLPLASKVFNKPFVGGLGEEVGLSKLFPFSARLFGGVVYNKEFRGSAQVPHRVCKVQYGIELSMSSAIAKLKGNTSTKNNSTTSTKSN